MRLPRESTPSVRNRRMNSISSASRLCSVDGKQRGLSQVAGSYARDGYWWCLPEGSLGPECSSFSLMHSSWPSLDPHCICCRVAPLPAGPSTPWASVNSTGSLATQEALVVDCLACPFPMRSYCLCPQTRRSCHTGTTV